MTDWKVSGLAEVAEVGPARPVVDLPENHPVTFVPMAAVKEGGGGIAALGVRPWSEIKKGYTVFQPGDVLLAKITPCMENGKIATVPPLPDDIGAGSTEFHVIRPGADLRPDWLRYFLIWSETRRNLRASMTGTAGQLRVPKGAVQLLEIPVPSRDTQGELVAVLDAHTSRLDAATATLERAQRNLKRYRASVLKAAVEGRLVPTEAALARAEGRSYEPASVLLDRILAERRALWEASGKKGTYKEPVAPDTTGLPELPEGWRWGSLPQIGELGRGKSKHRPRNDPRLLGGPHPFIQTGDVRRSGGRITRYSSTYSDFGLEQSRMWPAGTICITIAANIAETGILGFEACFPDSVVGLLVTGPSEVAEFVEYFIRTARGDLSRYAPATAQKNINLEILEQVVVPLPPLAEIGRIVDEISRCLTVADAAETSVVADLTRLERLRGSVLRAAFRGELG